MLKLYGTYRSRAARNIWLADEMGLRYELVPVIQAYRLPNPESPSASLNTRSAAFLAINPSGLVPAMADGEVVLTESLAINLYLARKHGGPLAPASLGEEGRALQWTLWAATTVEPLANVVLAHRIMKPEGERDRKAAADAVESLRTPFAVLDKALAASGGYLLGGRFTVADINVAEVIRYTMAAPELFERAPHVKAWLSACHARPAFKTLWAKREAEPATIS